MRPSESVKDNMISGQTRLLLISDSANYRHNLANGLRSYGFRVFESDSDWLFIERALKAQPAFVLLDMEVGHHSGLRVLCELRANGMSRSVPVGLLLGSEHHSQDDAAMGMSVAACFRKEAAHTEDIVQVLLRSMALPLVASRPFAARAGA